MKCLIVDDEEFNRDYGAALLGNDSECDHAGNGRDAVANNNSSGEWTG